MPGPETAVDILHNSRFQLIRKLGEGGMGAVYLVHDRVLDADVALKVLPTVDGESLSQFKQEFRSLSQIVHPNLVSLYELISEGNQWYFTMEHVPGTHFQDWIQCLSPDSTAQFALAQDQTVIGQTVAPAPRLDSQALIAEELRPVATCDWGKLRQAFLQLATGLNALHQAGKIHRDIKPSNVLVRANGEVVILDFGLIVDQLRPQRATSDRESDSSSVSWSSAAQQSLRQGAGVAGTAKYMSPEQASGLVVTPAADWYALGVMLYEAICGELPFRGKMLQIMEAKKTHAAPALASQVQGVPDDIAAICDQLLHREPQQRPMFEDLLRVFDVACSVRLPDKKPPSQGQFIGRETQLAALESACATMLAGGRVAVSISGKSGFGKSTLIDHFLVGVSERQSVIVLQGRCYEQESVPFKTLDSLIDSLVRFLSGLPESEAAKLVPRHVKALVRLFPVLDQLECVRTAPEPRNLSTDARDIRKLAFQALAEWMARIGDRAPLILFVDDLQWGDSDSVEALQELLLPENAGRVMLITSHREENGLTPEYARLMRTLAAAERVEFSALVVGPLTGAEAEQVVTTCLQGQPLSPAATQRIIDDSGGNPLFLQELTQHYLSQRESLDAPSMGLSEVIRHRVEGLDVFERGFLELLAISGKPTSLADMLDSLPRMPNPHRTIAHLRSERLLRGLSVNAKDAVEVYHDRIREAVWSGLPPQRVASHHRALAETLLQRSNPDAESLATHLAGGGDTARAGLWYARAAQKATAALAFEHAVGLYEKSLAVRPVTGVEELNLRRELALAYANAGRGRQSAEQYLRIADLSEEPARLDLQAQAASQLSISGHIDKGLELFSGVLRAYQIQLPTSRGGVLRDLLWQRFRLWLRGLRFQPRTADEIPESTRKRIDNLWAISSGLSTVNNLSAAALQSRLLRECLDSGDVYRVSRSLAWEAFLTCAAGDIPKSQRLLSQATELAERSGNPHAVGMSLLAGAMTEFQRARFPQAIEAFDKAEAHFRSQLIGGWWELATIRWIRGTILVHAGELKQISTFAARDHREAQERGDLFSATNMQAYLLPYLELTRGNYSAVRESIDTARKEWNHAGFHYQHLQSTVIECFMHLCQRQPEQAQHVLESLWPKMNQALLFHNKFVRVMMVDTRATCALGAGQVTSNPKLIATAEKYGRALWKEGDAWSRSFAHRILGGVARQRGQTAQASEHWEQAITGFNQSHMKLHATSVSFALAQIAAPARALELRQQAGAMFEQEGITAVHAFRNCLTWAPE